jgi:hypothetical protein
VLVATSQNLEGLGEGVVGQGVQAAG